MSWPIIRPVRLEDFGAIFDLAKQSGGGMTNLPNDEKALRSRIEKAVASFAAGANKPGEEVYLMVLDIGGKAMGTCAVFSSIGLDSGFVNYHVNWTFHASEQVGKRIRRRLLVPTHDFTGSAEVGSLFLSPDARGGGFGKLLSRARYLFIAQKPGIIADPVCAELRGWRAPDGGQPFWDALGRHFFDMEFEEADVHNSATGNQFIADLMPRYPIYVCLLPDAAIDCIGKPHDSALPAYRMLESEGFEFDDYIDIFDGGPLMHAKQQNIRTIYESDVATVKIGDPVGSPKYLLAAGEVANFRCGAGKAQPDEDVIVIEQAFADALKVKDGDKVRFVPW